MVGVVVVVKVEVEVEGGNRRFYRRLRIIRAIRALRMQSRNGSSRKERARLSRIRRGVRKRKAKTHPLAQSWGQSRERSCKRAWPRKKSRRSKSR